MAARPTSEPSGSNNPSPVLQAANIFAPTPQPTMDKPKGRNLILCFDGTTNKFDAVNTNVVKFYALLKKDDAEQQICYYQPGIGTYIQPGIVSPLFLWGAKILDEAFAWYLDDHVRGGYTFLMQNWRPGDKICIFGFSRGAYTARALAGLIHKIGLLPKDNPEQVPFAYKLFKKTDKASLEIAAGFKRTFCRTVEIEFVGVWDTVASVGVLMGRNLPFTTSNTTIKTFRHALSLDEHRVKFRPNLYHRPAPDAESAKRDPNQASPVMDNSEDAIVKMAHSVQHGGLVRRVSGEGKKGKDTNRKKETVNVPATSVGSGLSPVVVEETTEASSDDVSFEDPMMDFGADEVKLTDVLEVWFAGCHSDVGGGALPDATEHSLEDITLRWMVRQVVLSQVGINFDADALTRAHIPNSVFTGVGFPLTPSASSSGGGVQMKLKAKSTENGDTIQEEDGERDGKAMSPFASPKKLALEVPGVTAGNAGSGADGDGASQHSAALTETDAVQPLHDELQSNLLWWLLEILPLSYSYQDGKGVWHTKFGFHLGKGRHIADVKPNFHKSVQERMADATLKYIPRAMWKNGTETYVE